MRWVALTTEERASADASNASDRPAWIFIEDEGPHVGKCSVDPGLFARMRNAPLVVNVVAPRATRLRTLVEDYAAETHRADPAWRGAMDESVGKLRKRLGTSAPTRCAGALREGDFAAVADGLLEYYDGLYDKHLGSKRVEKRERQAARRRERVGANDDDAKEDDAATAAETTSPALERTTLEQAARAGEVVECRARAVGERDRDGRHPDSLDVDALVRDILNTVNAFEAEEAERGSAGGSGGAYGTRDARVVRTRSAPRIFYRNVYLKTCTFVVSKNMTSSRVRDVFTIAHRRPWSGVARPPTRRSPWGPPRRAGRVRERPRAWYAIQIFTETSAGYPKTDVVLFATFPCGVARPPTRRRAAGAETAEMRFARRKKKKKNANTFPQLGPSGTSSRPRGSGNRRARTRRGVWARRGPRPPWARGPRGAPGRRRRRRGPRREMAHV